MEPSEATIDIGSLHDRALHCKELASIPQADDDVDSPCHLMRMPPEIRREIFTYLIPEEPIESHLTFDAGILTKARLRTKYPISLSELFLSFDRAIYEEIKETFYSIIEFVIRLDRDGILLCGVLLLGLTFKSGILYRKTDQTQVEQFVRNFAWSAVRNYSVHIVIGRGENPMQPTLQKMLQRHPEVELYKLRDYVSEVVSGVLAKADHLRNLKVAVEIKDKGIFSGDPFRNAKLLIEPLQRLRGVLNPKFLGVTEWISIPEPGPSLPNSLTKVKPFTRVPLPIPNLLDFVDEWRLCVASGGSTKLLPRSSLTRLFDQFKTLYHKLVQFQPDIVENGPGNLLHQARVAHEQNDVAHLRKLFVQLREFWQTMKQAVEPLLQRVIEADPYAETLGPLWS